MSIKYKKDGIEINGEFLSLVTITEKCNEIKLKEDKLVIIQMSWDSRGGSVFEQRSLPLEKALRVKEILLGETVDFGEIWGKHSEVYGQMEENDFKIIDDKKKVKEFLRQHTNGIDYDHSFIERFIERAEENLEYNEEDHDVDQETIDELNSLLR